MKHFRLAAAGAVALLAWGCMLTPGRFEASLDVRRDGSFRYAYAGEMIFVGPGTTAAEPSDPPFDPEEQVCTGDPDGRGTEPSADTDPDLDGARECTAKELAEKRREYEEGRAKRLGEKMAESAMARAVLGGIDPSDPKTMDEFARRLQGNSGFKRVQHKGNGVFDVQFELSGSLDRDFVFPVFPDVEFIVPFVKVVRLTGNRVRILAPAFSQKQDGFKSFSSMFQEKSGAPLRRAEGNFTVTTDAEIVTNNTQDGPVRAANGRTMRWLIGPLDTKTPEALLQL